MGDRPFLVSVCDEEGEARWWQWQVDPKTRQPIVPEKERREVQLVVGDRGIAKDFFNARFDVGMLKEIGITVRGEINEVAYMARCVNNLEMNIKLKPLAKKYVGIDDDDQKDLHAVVVKCRRIAKKLGWSLAEDVEADYWVPYTLHKLRPDLLKEAEIDYKVTERYAVRDAERTILLSAFFRHGMKDLGVEQAYKDEMALLPVTCAMEERGITIDPIAIERCAQECKKKIATAHAFVTKAYGKGFNVNSPKQVVQLLFGGQPLRLPVIHTTPTGQPETGGEALLPHIAHPLVSNLLSYRANTKALSTFFEKYKKLAVNEPGRGLVLHPGFKQDGALTWRYSCSEPNLQAVSNPATTSSRTAQFVVDVRQVFVPEKGRVWYTPDYSQVEVIIFADIAQEPTMLRAIKDGYDIHEATSEKIWGGKGNPKTRPCVKLLLSDQEALDAARVHLNLKHKQSAEFIESALLDKHGWKISEIEKAVDKKIYRKLAKSVTFTKIFGGGPPALMSWIGVGQDEAKRILDEYESAFPKMMESMREIEREGLENGFVTTAFGHRLAVDRWYAYRAVNHKVQGSAAGLMKRGMRNVTRYFQETGIDARIAATIHDELILDFAKTDAFKRVLREVIRIMEDHGGAFSIPTPVEMDKVTERWSKKEEVTL